MACRSAALQVVCDPSRHTFPSIAHVAPTSTTSCTSFMFMMILSDGQAGECDVTMWCNPYFLPLRKVPSGVGSATSINRPNFAVAPRQLLPRILLKCSDHAFGGVIAQHVR